jgi:hypothetical protein
MAHGERSTIRRGELAVATATIRSVEIHPATGTTTIAIDELFAGAVVQGSTPVSL